MDFLSAPLDQFVDRQEGLLQPQPLGGAAGLDLPHSVCETVQVQLVGDLRRRLDSLFSGT